MLTGINVKSDNQYCGQGSSLIRETTTLPQVTAFPEIGSGFAEFFLAYIIN